ncbi:MAG: hypothetical protein KGI08_10945, partial [Thaumarchaeota archaeon]|nr:hypothetical protein [Nitrososphaerota archaeon]
AHVVWCFCTTNPAKIPATLKSRCSQFQLKPVDDASLLDLLDFVCDQEKIGMTDDVANLLVKEAKGSPRQLLSNIVVARTAKTKKEAADLLKSAIESDVTLELCRFVANGGGSWTKCTALLDKIEDNPESVRILIFNYLAACLKGAKSDKDAVFFLQKLEAFSQPYNGTDGIAPLLLSIGRAMFAE